MSDANPEFLGGIGVTIACANPPSERARLLAALGALLGRPAEHDDTWHHGSYLVYVVRAGAESTGVLVGDKQTMEDDSDS